MRRLFRILANQSYVSQSDGTIDNNDIGNINNRLNNNTTKKEKDINEYKEFSTLDISQFYRKRFPSHVNMYNPKLLNDHVVIDIIERQKSSFSLFRENTINHV